MTTEADPFLAEVTLALWQPHLGSRFTLQWAGGQEEALELIEAQALSNGSPAPGRAPFSLLFRAAARTFLVPQGIYALSHPAFPTMELFLVPIGPDAVGMCFQAIFS